MILTNLNLWEINFGQFRLHTSIAFFNDLSLNAVRALRLLSTDSGTAGSLFGAL